VSDRAFGKAFVVWCSLWVLFTVGAARAEIKNAKFKVTAAQAQTSVTVTLSDATSNVRIADPDERVAIGGHIYRLGDLFWFPVAANPKSKTVKHDCCLCFCGVHDYHKQCAKPICDLPKDAEGKERAMTTHEEYRCAVECRKKK
jgi:hypothetical protein